MSRRLISALILSLTAAISAPSWADGIYKYIDDNGRVVFTNVVPKGSTDDAKESVTVTNRKRVKSGSGPGELESSKELANKITALVEKYDLGRFKLGSDFVRAVIKVESNFNPNAISRKGALGLMQLMPATARRFGVRNIYNPEQNLEGGIQYLNFLLDTFNGDVNLSLAAYNAGENVVQRLKGIPPYRETRDYVKKISEILGGSQSIPLYDPANKRVTYVALVEGKLKFTNVDPPTSAVVFDGIHLPRAAGSI